MIYIHVPFCHRKCTYCAFYSKVAKGQVSIGSYVDALLAEMEQRKGEQAHPIRTVYFGGGTPSILPIAELARIIDGLHRCFDLSQLEEMTIEANPEDLLPQYLVDMSKLGFNRISIGIQSLDDKILRLLNRRHTAQQALDAIHNSHAAGFDNISVDFIYGITDGQVMPEVFEGVTHVSAYALTVEQGTALAVQVERGMVQLPDEDEVVRQYHALHRRLTKAGFHQYEVSNYARPGYESKHNSRYWDRTPYLGLGPAAHSFDGQHRRWNVSDVEKYISCQPGRTCHEEETLSETDAYNELLMTSLRTTRGLPLTAVPKGQKERLHRLMQPYINCGWIVLNNGHYSPTEEGLLHADGIAADLFIGGA